MKYLSSCFVLALCLLVGCSTLTRLGGAVGGAAGGAVIGGPAGAAVGAAGGFLLAETSVPSPPEVCEDQPQTAWGLIAQLVDQAAWLAFVVGLLWLLTWIAPSPKELFKRISGYWKKTT